MKGFNLVVMIVQSDAIIITHDVEPGGNSCFQQSDDLLCLLALPVLIVTREQVSREDLQVDPMLFGYDD